MSKSIMAIKATVEAFIAEFPFGLKVNPVEFTNLIEHFKATEHLEFKKWLKSTMPKGAIGLLTAGDDMHIRFKSEVDMVAWKLKWL